VPVLILVMNIGSFNQWILYGFFLTTPAEWNSSFLHLFANVTLHIPPSCLFTDHPHPPSFDYKSKAPVSIPVFKQTTAEEQPACANFKHKTNSNATYRVFRQVIVQLNILLHLKILAFTYSLHGAESFLRS